MALAQRTNLLRAEQDDDQRYPNAVAFTHLAAHELADEGFAPVKSTDKDDTHGIKAGFLVNRETREHFRIISNLETPNQVVVWEELPRAGKEVEFVAPLDPAQSPALQAALAGKGMPKGKPGKGSGSKSDTDKAGSGSQPHA
jgi:hypothetical protein